MDLSSEIKKLEEKLAGLRKETYENLSPWQKVQLARHPQRPYTLDYIEKMCTDFVELHGDRAFKDDLAIVGGFAALDSEKVMIIGTQKGRDVKSNVARNFGADSVGHQRIENALNWDKWRDDLFAALANYADDRRAWDRVLAAAVQQGQRRPL